MEHLDFSNLGGISDLCDLDALIDTIASLKTVKTNKKIEYFNIPCSFDIETSSFFRLNGKEEEKIAIMYEWTLGICGKVFIGRTWDEFINVIKNISVKLNLWKERRLIIYVHNLSYEFQFFRKLFKWINVFSIDKRKPIYALNELGIEFRCSYMLSGYGLSKLGEQLNKYKITKMVGDLDYKLIRTSHTPLSEKEKKYCENDVRVVMSYIQEQIEELGDITKLPLTKTGFVRNYCRNNCLYNGSHKKGIKKYNKYTKLMYSLTIEPDEYKQLKRAFQGGFTHANAFKSGKIFYKVGSYDFTSSYPAVMVSEKYPMSKAEKVNISSIDEFEHNLNLYCCLFDVEIWGLESSTFIEHPLSVSRCYKCIKAVEDNGRIVQAEYICTTLTEQDYMILSEFYKWDSISIGNFKRYKRGYLPTEFVKSVLKLYQDKTTLKGVEGKETEYLKSKEMANSSYGMCVTDICRSDIEYKNDTWLENDSNVDESIDKYNKSKRRFLFYPWGVWVTAYARKNLFTGIVEFGNDYIYSDTDSIKGINHKNHNGYIKAYNDMIIKKLETAMKFHGLDNSEFKPKTINGEEKILGVWDYEGEYTRFKTLGAKRYIVEKDNTINITVSGLNKHKTVPYLLSKFEDPFEGFADGLYIPPEYTGKNTHTYIDDVKEGEIKDYLGNYFHYKELSSVHLSESDYSLSLSSAYLDYLLGIKQYEN